jgi:hypothetical protein
MKLLFQTDRQPEAVSAKLLLESKGIPAFIGSERSGQVLGGIFSSTYSLWVELDHQYDDARAILADPEHTPAQPVSIDEYNAFKARWQRRFDVRVRSALRLMLLAALLAGAWLLAGRLLDAMPGG